MLGLQEVERQKKGSQKSRRAEREGGDPKQNSELERRSEGEETETHEKGTVNVNKKSKPRSKQLNNTQQQVNDARVSTLNHPVTLARARTHTGAQRGAQRGACSPTNHLYIKTSLCWLTAAKIPARPRCHKSSAVAEPQREPFHLGMSKLS